MKKLKVTIILLFLMLSALFADVPSRINFQGRLLDANKNPRSGIFNMTFSIWDAPTGGSQIWSETQSVEVINGMFSVQLGASNPLSANVFSSPDRWLQIQVGTEVLTPRERLLSSAYAFRSAVADTVVAGSITDNEISSTANISWDKISKVGSSLSHLEVRSASDLNSGTLPPERLSGDYLNSVRVSSAIYAEYANFAYEAEKVEHAHTADRAGRADYADLAYTVEFLPPHGHHANDIVSGVLSASRGGTGIAGAGGAANRVLVTTNGISWTAGQINPATMISSGTLPTNVIASSVAVNSVGSAQIINNTITDEDISSAANISWAKISKAGSSLADLTTRSASDLNSGNLDIARMPTGGNWNITTNLSISGSTFVVTTGGNLGIGTDIPSSKLDIVGGSITVRGTNAGINVVGGTVTASGFIGSGAGLTGITLPQLADVADFTAQTGDLLVRTATGWDRLPAGTAGWYLMTNGPNANPSWAPINAIIDPITTIFLYDEFIGGLTTSGNIGNLGWTLNNIGAAPTLSAVAGELNRWGILRVQTTATAGQGGTVSLANITATTLSARPQSGTVIRFALRLNATTQVIVRIGLADSPTAAQPTNGIYFEYNAGATVGSWIGVCRSGGVQSTTGNMLTGDINWHRFQIRYSGGVVYFSIDGGAEQTVSTNIPANTVGLQPSFRIVTNEGVTKAMDIDYYNIVLTGLTR